MIAAYETYAKDSTEVGGDFYDFYMIGDDKLAIIVADISGKAPPISAGTGKCGAFGLPVQTAAIRTSIRRTS